MGIGMVRSTPLQGHFRRRGASEERGQGTEPGRVRRLVIIALGLAFIGLCLVPSLLCLRHPTIFYDDVVRVAQLHDHGFARNLFVPINEHMQPFFQAITALAWRSTGERVSGLPRALAIASATPFALSLVLLGILVHRCHRSRTAALLAAALFSFSSISYYETVVWYSASSFQWALAWTLAALIGVTQAGSEGSHRVHRLTWWTLAIVSSAMAAACCGVGLLAGPAAGLWWLSDRRVVRTTGRWARAAIPILGTAAHLAICFMFRYQDKLSAQMQQNPYHPQGLLNVYRAPIDVLLPAIAGWRNIDGILPDAAVLGLFAAGLAAIAWAARRSPDPRSYVVGAFLILADYFLIYGSRYLPGDERWVLGVERYHLLPQLGLTLILAPALAMMSRRLDRRPVAGLLAATSAALILLALHSGTLTTLSRFYRFPDQARTLAALDRLTAACRANRIGRRQVLAAFDPIRRKWFPADRPEVLGMIPETAAGKTLADAQVRPAIVSALDHSDIEAICGGMDATPYLRPAGPNDERSTAGELVKVSGLILVQGQTYRSTREGSFLEYRFRSPVPEARALRLAVDTTRSRGPISVDWAGEDGWWTVMRSIHWSGLSGTPDAVLPLDRLPHWNKERVTRIRIVLGEAGMIGVSTPRLIR